MRISKHEQAIRAELKRVGGDLDAASESMGDLERTYTSLLARQDMLRRLLDAGSDAKNEPESPGKNNG